jgi:hypothetical protein
MKSMALMDDIYKIEDILNEESKQKYRIEIKKSSGALPEDEIHLGYFKLNKL